MDISSDEKYEAELHEASEGHIFLTLQSSGENKMWFILEDDSFIYVKDGSTP